MFSVSTVARLAIACLGHCSGEVNFTSRSLHRLTGVRTSKVYQIQAWFEALRDQSLALREDLMVMNAMRRFQSACRELDNKPVGDPWRALIDGCYVQSDLLRLTELSERMPISANPTLLRPSLCNAIAAAITPSGRHQAEAR